MLQSASKNIKKIQIGWMFLEALYITVLLTLSKTKIVIVQPQQAITCAKDLSTEPINVQTRLN